MREASGNREALLHVFWHDDCLKHDNGAGFFDMPQGTLADDFLEVKVTHPEGVDRVKNMRSILKVDFNPVSPIFRLNSLYLMLQSAVKAGQAVSIQRLEY